MAAANAPTKDTAGSTPPTAIPDDEYDYLFKVVLIGDSGVGKSNLLRYPRLHARRASSPSTQRLA
jgi:hypothetical protein